MKNNWQGNLHNGLIYTSPTKDRPWTGIRFTSPLLIKRKGPKWGGVCVCICLFGFMCRCAHAAIGRPISTCEKGQKHPRLRLTSLEKTTKRSTSPGAVQSYRRGAEGWRTHTHTSGNVGEGRGRIFPLAISMSSNKFLDECWVWTMASNTRQEWVRGKLSPNEYANHYPMNGYEIASWIVNQFMLLFQIHFFKFTLFLLFKLFILHVTPLL